MPTVSITAALISVMFVFQFKVRHKLK